jgi:integrase
MIWMSLRLTDRMVKGLPGPATGNHVYYDETVKGLGARVTAAGARAFVLNYRRKADGVERRYTIGSFPEWTVLRAREEAKRLKREIDGGADPVGEHRETRAAATMADLCDRFLNDFVPRKRPATQRDYRQQITIDIRPALGHMKVAAVSLADVDGWHRKISKRAPTHANRALAVLSKMFSMAIVWGLRDTNPCKGIERNQEHKRQRYLTGPELTRVTDALAELRDQGAADAIRLLLLTGARRGELLAARWSDIDIDAGVWTKPGSTTKQKTTHRVPLSEAACKLLKQMREQDNGGEWLFPAPRKAGPRTDIDDAWNELRKAAGIPDVRLHDCRHSFASILASQGLSLPVIGALLGHSTPHTTARYSHLLDDPLRRATEQASAIITGKPSAKVVPWGRT